jgi:predicted patatin/cPLA2 family phospholipase
MRLRSGLERSNPALRSRRRADRRAGSNPTPSMPPFPRPAEAAATHARCERVSGASSSAHPVVELLFARRAAGSKPRARDDGARVALVIEGGAMRGIVSCAMAGALESAGLADTFDLVVGTSAGALNGAALLAGVAEGCTRAYATDFTSRRFIDVRRLLIGRPAVDVAWSLDFACDYLDAERHRRTLESPIELHCMVVDVDTCAAVDLTGCSTLDDQRAALLASSRMPYVGGEPVELNGRRYLDGGLVEPIPLRPALSAGATHVLVLQTRPEGVPRAHPGRVVDRLIERRLRAINADLVDVWRRRTPDYERIVAEIAAGGPSVLGIRPPAGTPVVSQLERDPEKLRGAAGAAREQTEAVLDSVLPSTERRRSGCDDT